MLQLTRTVICDPSVLKHGVRYIFALDGSMVTDVDQLEDGQAYVCSSSGAFKPFDYLSIRRVDWVSASCRVSTPAIVKQSESFLARFQQPARRRHGNRSGPKPAVYIYYQSSNQSVVDGLL